MKKKELVIARLTSAFGPGIALLFFIAVVASVHSGPVFFDTQTAYAQSATLSQPAMNQVQCSPDGTSATLSWGSVSGAEVYALRVDDTSNNASSCLDGWYCNSSQDYLNDSRTSRSFTKTITPGRAYQWWVQAKKANTWSGVSGMTKVNFSCAAPAQAQAQAPAPASMTASCNTAGTQATLSWSSVAGATTYQPRFARPSIGSCPSGWSMTPDGSTCYRNDMTANSVTVPVVPGSAYDAWVHAVTAAGGSEATHVPGNSFTCSAPAVIVPPPTNMVTSCNTAGDKLTFSWTAPSGYTHFYTRGIMNGVNVPEAWVEDFVGTTKTITVTPGQPYVVWVHTRASDSTWSNPLTSQTITCTPSINQPPPAPANLNASCNTAGTQATLSWNASPGATNYWFRATGVSQSDCALKGSNWQWLASGGINYCYPMPDTAPNTTSVTFPTTPGTTYAWSVAASNANGYSPSSGSSLTCQPSAGGVPAVLSNSSNAVNWMVKDVCVDSANKPTSADPYYVCPAGTTRRKIDVGDRVSYHNIDQGRWQQSDSFPLLDASGQKLYFHSFDFPPFNQYNTYDGADGYDVYTTRDGYFSASNTADGGGFRTTFYGQNCTFGSGWVFFPLSNFLSGGEQAIPISGVYWEQGGQLPPGNCPAGYSNSLTTWKLVPNSKFSGIFGNPEKTMNAMVSWHGYENSQQFTSYGHLEVFYFTQQYGLTKWEVWRPVEQGKTKASYCSGPETVTYQGRQFVVDACRDWSITVPEPTPSIPMWPLSNANKLNYWHFNDGGFDDATSTSGKWRRFGTSPAGNLINWSVLNSTSALDTQYNSVGVRYLALNCGAGANGQCGTPGSQAIYQDLPASSFTNNATYLFGASARTTGGTGTIQIAVQVISNTGSVLWQDVIQDTVTPLNGTAPFPNAGTSIYLSSKFMGKTVKIPITSSASKVRFMILPITSNTFEVMDTFINPFPTMK